MLSFKGLNKLGDGVPEEVPPPLRFLPQVMVSEPSPTEMSQVVTRDSLSGSYRGLRIPYALFLAIALEARGAELKNAAWRC